MAFKHGRLGQHNLRPFVMHLHSQDNATRWTSHFKKEVYKVVLTVYMDCFSNIRSTNDGVSGSLFCTFLIGVGSCEATLSITDPVCKISPILQVLKKKD